MKRFALALMLLIGMIGYTGFGNTTTDLAKNSTTVVSDIGDADNVVVFETDFVHTLKHSHVDVGKGETNGFTKLFRLVNDGFDKPKIKGFINRKMSLNRFSVMPEKYKPIGFPRIRHLQKPN